MPKSLRMTEREKGMIDAFKGEEKSNRWIANKLGRDESSIRYYLKNKEKKMEKRGPKIKLSKLAKNLILRNSSNKMVSVDKLKYDLDLKVSGETIRRVLKASPNIKFKKMLLKPPLDG
jgi:IS30 family transposase